LINRDLSVLGAKARIIRAILEFLESELSVLQVRFGQDLKLRAPIAEACFNAGRRIDSVLLGAAPVVFIVEQIQPTRAIEDLSLGHNASAPEDLERVRVQHVDLPLRVRLVFSEPADFYAFEFAGKKVTRGEWIQVASELYKGAVINVLSRHAADKAYIQDLLIETDMAFSEVLTEGSDSMMLGGCMLEIVVRQQVSVPFHKWSYNVV
jgi:hypothetical protein